jgi:CheY-like chemotaxis protein
MLLVDDEPLRRAQRAPAFDRYGFEVTTAANAAEAIEILRAGWVCDMVVIDLRAGPIHAVALLNALRGVRAWLPAVVLGTDRQPPGAVLRDRGVQTVWSTSETSTLALSGLIMTACCPGRQPDYCPFRTLIGPYRAPPVPGTQAGARAGAELLAIAC